MDGMQDRNGQQLIGSGHDMERVNLSFKWHYKMLMQHVTAEKPNKIL